MSLVPMNVVVLHLRNADVSVQLMQTSTVLLLEPIMQLEVVVEDEYSGPVMADLRKRRAEIHDFDVRGDNKVTETFQLQFRLQKHRITWITCAIVQVIKCLIPLAETLGYSTALRIVSSGHATFSMEFSRYEPLDSYSEAEVIKKLTGVN